MVWDKQPPNHISRYKTLAVRDKATGQIMRYKNNPDYSVTFTCTKYPERVYDDIYCEHKGDNGVGACEDCQYLDTAFENAKTIPENAAIPEEELTDKFADLNNLILEEHPYCVHEQEIPDEDSLCKLLNCRVSFEECADCEAFEPRPPRYAVVKSVKPSPQEKKNPYVCTREVNKLFDNNRVNKPCIYKINGSCGDCVGLYDPASKNPARKPVEPLTDRDILDLIGETGLEIS